MERDSTANTIAVALSLCLICSFFVSAAAVGLKRYQDRNVELDRKKNILEVVGFSREEIESSGGIEKLFKDRFNTEVINLASGQPALEQLIAALKEAGLKYDDDEVIKKYDPIAAAKSKKKPLADVVPRKQDIAKIKYREKFSLVYVLKSKEDSQKVEMYVFPIRGYGLWSMLKGYLAVEPDFQTVAGITFYEQKETPGLGGEVERDSWKKSWKGKKIYDGDEVKLRVVKGAATNEYEVDGLSGATLTSNGVSYMIKYWMGPEGFFPYIEHHKTDRPAGESSDDQGGSDE